MRDTIESVNLALLDAFDPESLERMVRFGLNERLDEIAHGRDLTATVFRLTDWAERQGKLGELVEAAKQSTPNQRVKALDIREDEREARQRYRSEAAGVNSELIEHRLTSLQEEMKKLRADGERKEAERRDELAELRRIMIGPDGAGGLRQIVFEAQRTSQENSRQIALFDQQRRAPGLLATRASRIIFGIVLAMLVAIFVLVLIDVAGPWLTS